MPDDNQPLIVRNVSEDYGPLRIEYDCTGFVYLCQNTHSTHNETGEDVIEIETDKLDAVIAALTEVSQKLRYNDPVVNAIFAPAPGKGFEREVRVIGIGMLHGESQRTNISQYVTVVELGKLSDDPQVKLDYMTFREDEFRVAFPRRTR